jgi:sn-glycerol 3-phosphate transport system permease protein
MSYALVSVTLIVTSSPSARPLAVGLSLFAAPASSIDIPVTSVATVMVPMLSPLRVTSTTQFATGGVST